MCSTFDRVQGRSAGGRVAAMCLSGNTWRRY